MPYKDIQLTLLGGRKCLINPGSIKGMLEFPNETVITLVKGLNFYPYQIIVLEKIDEIKKKFKSISEKQYWKYHPIKGLKPDFVIYDELKLRSIKKILILIKDLLIFGEGLFEFKLKKFCEELQRFTKGLPREID